MRHKINKITFKSAFDLSDEFIYEINQRLRFEIGIVCAQLVAVILFLLKKKNKYIVFN